MTNEGERNKSRSEFDNTYFYIDDDIENLIDTNFGLKENELAKYARYLKEKGSSLEKLSQILFLHLKIANGIYW